MGGGEGGTTTTTIEGSGGEGGTTTTTTEGSGSGGGGTTTTTIEGSGGTGGSGGTTTTVTIPGGNGGGIATGGGNGAKGNWRLAFRFNNFLPYMNNVVFRNMIYRIIWRRSMAMRRLAWTPGDASYKQLLMMLGVRGRMLNLFLNNYNIRYLIRVLLRLPNNLITALRGRGGRFSMGWWRYLFHWVWPQYQANWMRWRMAFRSHYHGGWGHPYVHPSGYGSYGYGGFGTP